MDEIKGIAAGSPVGSERSGDEVVVVLLASAGSVRSGMAACGERRGDDEVSGSRVVVIDAPPLPVESSGDPMKMPPPVQGRSGRFHRWSLPREFPQR